MRLFGLVAALWISVAPVMASAESGVEFWHAEGAVVVPAKVQDIDRLEAQRKTFAPRKTLPARCRTILRAGGTDSVVYRADCLARNVSDRVVLPALCETVVTTRNGDVALFREQCLSENGWR